MTSTMLDESVARPQQGTRPGSRWLFVKERFAWPRASGHDVHTFHMMKALVEAGHQVSVLTLTEPPAEALAGLQLHRRYCLERPSLPGDEVPIRLTTSQAKFASYWGVSEENIRQVGAAALDCQADAVVVSGLNVLPYLGAVAGAKRVWYAADEWVWHHLSQVKLLQPSSYREMKPAIIKGLYERAYRSLLDRVWVVSDADARAFRWLVGLDRLDIIPNGVDPQHYSPGQESPSPRSCVFWGRLDFGPNIQALEWFCRQVWPEVRKQVPDARFEVFGFQPTERIYELTRQPGIQLKPDLPDLRSAVRSCEVVVLPFISGGGIKNKLLEAAAMGMPIICSPRALHGLKGTPPLQVADHAQEWQVALRRMWSEPARREEAGRSARNWVQQHHTWTAAALQACKGLGFAALPTGNNAS